ncbi:MAG: zinc ribbon domain-containing protein [Clostridia bacterium]|nr:zinc ribbon domain-containing protein [Clostridia bacterium]
MKIRYVIDIDVDYDYENLDELQFKLKDELEEYVKDSELGYYADKTSVKLQDDYCIKEERKKLKKQIPKKPIITVDCFFNGQPIYDTWGCPNCGKVNDTDFEDYQYCPDCGQALDWSDHPTEKGGADK